MKKKLIAASMAAAMTLSLAAWLRCLQPCLCR